MNLTNIELRNLLVAAGLAALNWQLPDDSYETVSEQWVLDNWAAWLDARPIELCFTKEVGGKTLRSFPRWINNASDCDNLALGLMVHGDVGNGLAAFDRQEARGGLAFGTVFYTAETARPANYNAKGGHAVNWFVNHEGRVFFFEPGVGLLTELNPTERLGAWFGLAA